MTEYTPEKVAELVADNRKWVQLHRENKYQREAAMRMGRALDALTAVSANRDEFRTAWNAYGFEVIRLEDERDRLHKAITEALAERMSMGADRILRAALDKEGSDDE